MGDVNTNRLEVCPARFCLILEGVHLGRGLAQPD